MSPQAPLKPCPGNGGRCSALVRSGRCDKHGGPAQAWQHNAPVQRIRGSKLQALRRALFAGEPLCRPCAAQNRTTLATIRDHIVNVEEGGTEEPNNIQPICEDCHRAKTHSESMRGQERRR